MIREIKLDGGEITVLKQIGLSGTQVFGKQLVGRIKEMETAEFLDTLQGLIALGYVVSTRVNIRVMEDVENAFFRVNSSYVRDLRTAINPGRRREKEREARQRRG